MKLAYLRERYTYYSGEASGIVRQLAFAGIALVWLFKTEVDKQWKIPAELLPATALIVLTLILDFLQYVVGSLVWAAYNRSKERAGTNEESEFLAPRPINWPTNFSCVAMKELSLTCFKLELPTSDAELITWVINFRAIHLSFSVQLFCDRRWP